jgi:hypothetical protein
MLSRTRPITVALASACHGSNSSDGFRGVDAVTP